MTEYQKRERKVLAAFTDSGRDFSFACFSVLMERTKLPRREVRVICRRLARKGLAQYGRGLWTEDGEPYGSGYAITEAGRLALSSSSTGVGE